MNPAKRAIEVDLFKTINGRYEWSIIELIENQWLTVANSYADIPDEAWKQASEVAAKLQPGGVWIEP